MQGAVDLTARIGDVVLPNPIMTASGTSGHGDELGHYFPLSELGAVVVKSLAAFEWAGNPAPRLRPVTGGMLNSVGLQGPGVAAWLATTFRKLERAGARVVASIWGRTVDDYAQAAKLLASASRSVVAVEVNLSCPNLDGGAHLFAHSPADTAAAVDAALACERPLWAKLSPNTDQLVAVARAASGAGADAVTLSTPSWGWSIDIERRSLALGGGGGGLSGRAHPSGRRASGVRRPRRAARPPDRRGRWRRHGSRRGRADDGGSVGSAGGNRDVRGPAGSACRCCTG